MDKRRESSSVAKRRNNKRKKASSDSEISSDEKQKTKSASRKQRYSSTSSSSSSSSSSSTSSTDSSEEERKRHRREKKKLKKLKKKIKKIDNSKGRQHKSDEDVEEASSTDIPINLMQKSKAMAPMTKEEWEKRQSVVKKVYDESTGRHRLIKGDGEVVEEIVSRDQHKSINKQATKGDGDFFQAKLSANLRK